jgi:signal transduction histidine kinase
MTIPKGMFFAEKEAEGYGEYLDWLSSNRLYPATRSAAWFVVGLNSFFLLLDPWVYPDRFAAFAAIRLSWSASMLCVVAMLGRFDPLLCARAGCVISGLFLIGLSAAGGGVTSPYWPAIMVLFLGMPVLMPLTAANAAGVVAVLTLAFAALPLVTGETVESRSYSVPVFFVLAAAIECVVSASVLDRMRFSDFSSRIEVEKARDHLKEMDRAKSRFTANIHHELRTPLTLILSPLAALQGGDYGNVPSQVTSVLGTMEVNARRLHKLINNLLDLAKLESQEFTIVRRPLVLRELVDEIVGGASSLAERKQVGLRISGFYSMPALNADRDALDKIIVNLLANALKFTDEGGDIEIWGAKAENGWTRLEVRDSGIGIPEEQLGRIFDRFAQVDGSNTRRYEGTGIGLSLVAELVELHDGRIWAESRGLGQGATMIIELPAGTPDDRDMAGEEVLTLGEGNSVSLGSSIAAVEAELGLDAGSESDRDSQVELERTVDRWSRKKEGVGVEADDALADAPEILIAEDNPDMRKLLSFLLGREFRVRVTENGREALHSLREFHPSAVVTDVMMPEMSGTELCRAIKEDADTQNIPVILVTSKAEHEMKIEGLELGADDYVTKPFHPRELLARVRSVVRVRSLQQELEQKNVSLENAVEELRNAQTRLVQQERLAAVGEVAAGVAHEVNNPVNFSLNAVRELKRCVAEIQDAAAAMQDLDLACNGLENEKISHLREKLSGIEAFDTASTIGELAEIVSEGLERTGALVGELQNFAAPDRGPRCSVNLGEGIRSTAALLRPTLEDLGAHLVWGSPSALNQVFLNIMKNAAEAMPSSGGDLNVNVEKAGDGSEVVIRFEDTGPGIDPEHIGRVFEPFFSTKAPGHGTGLGLSVSHQIIEDHGGSLTVESLAGAGSVFEVRLPASG